MERVGPLRTWQSPTTSISGSGRIVEPTPTATDAAGQVTLRWILGPFPGRQEIVVSNVLRVSATATGQLEPWKFRAITGNGVSTCALALDGRAYCWAGAVWSAGLYYELGNGSNTRPAPTPQPVTSQLTWIDLSMGERRTWGIASDGSLYWWGTSSYPAQQAKTPTAGPGGRWRQVALGGDHQCAIDELQQAYCWGRGSSGQLGTGTRDDKSAPTLVAGGHRWKRLADGATCGITVEDVGFCWGSSDGTALVPTPVYANERLRSMTAG
jgi:alpha-tubulin suppressor-like RCC1 family protein